MSTNNIYVMYVRALICIFLILQNSGEVVLFNNNKKIRFQKKKVSAQEQKERP